MYSFLNFLRYFYPNKFIIQSQIFPQNPKPSLSLFPSAFAFIFSISARVGGADVGPFIFGGPVGPVICGFTTSTGFSISSFLTSIFTPSKQLIEFHLA